MTAEQQQVLYSLEDFAELHSIGLRTVFSEISAGRLAARKIGRRTVITLEDAKTWVDRLPKMQSKAAVADGVCQ
jgi:hypothetical protein